MSIEGIWLAAKTHGSGFIITEKLIFHPDGTGTYEVYDWSLQFYEEFQWALLSEYRICITGTQRFFADEDRTTVLSIRSRFRFPDAAFSIQAHEPSDEIIKHVLRIELGINYADTYFLSGEPVDAHPPPEFRLSSDS